MAQRVDGGGHVGAGLRPSAAVADPAVLDIDHREPAAHQVGGQRTAELGAEVRRPVAAVDDHHDRRGRRSVRQRDLGVLAWIVTVGVAHRIHRVHRSSKSDATFVLHTTTVTTLAEQTRWMDAVDQAALVASGEVSPVELLEAAIERIERIDPALNAVVIRWFDHARETRRRRPARRARSAACRSCSRTSTRRTPGSRSATATSRSRSAHVVVRRRHHARRPLPGRRAGHRRPDEQPRARQRADHRAGGVGPDPQPVGPHPHAGRFQRRRGGGRRRRAWCRSPTPATAAARSASRPRAAGWSGSSRARAGSRSARSATRAACRRRALREPDRPRHAPRCSTRPADPASATP